MVSGFALAVRISDYMSLVELWCTPEGSSKGSRGVGYNCDFVSESINAVNPLTDVQCVADALDFVPWGVKTEFDVCQGKD